ncbi:hypothetical protein HMPREF1556_01592 [Porphyromonas sp. oral taxon 278 str. W7784]|jgi:hypothetical protein|nr:hypothetical protein HMPREF1556_01592 [Porphyromonas sp. oral taxon 278 str. W7784]
MYLKRKQKTIEEKLEPHPSLYKATGVVLTIHNDVNKFSPVAFEVFFKH